MAPIPDDNQEKPQSGEDELSSFSNGNVATITFSSDSSDENDETYPDSTGYTLLPQGPTGDDDDVDYYSENEINDSNANSLAFSHVYGEVAHGQYADNLDSALIADGASISPSHLPDEVIQTEGVTVAPTVSASSASHHPEFLAKFTDGKIPSYMQVPNIPSNSSDMLWNKRRSDKSVSLDTEDNKIMRAMSGFSLPTANVPEWAKNLSEDQWNNVISQQIKPSQQLMSDIACQLEQDPGPSLVCREQKNENTDWVADFSDS